jgi:putative ATP-dependent endonuclease of OLD family
MARLRSLCINGFRSVRNQIEICFPSNAPLILVGENNAGKTNIIRALDLILGEYWPGSKEPEDHEFWNRDAENGRIEISVSLDNLVGDGGVPLNSFRWVYDPNARGKKCEFTAISARQRPTNYVRNDWRDQCVCIWVSADRRLSYHLGYASKWTLLSKLMHKFHSALVQDQDRVQRLKEKFHEIEGIFQEVEDFAIFQDGLAQQFGEMFIGMSYGLQVDFSAYDPSRFFRSLQVVPQEDGERRTFEELGTGQEQLLALAFAHAYAKAFYGGIILAVEEPEAHLHPLAQEWLARKIHQMTNDGLQIVLTTHSPHFIDLLGLEGIVLVRKDEQGATNVRQTSREEIAQYCRDKGAHRKKTTPDTILPFYANQSTQEILNGFFAKKVVLVEGQTEQLALPVYLKKVGLDVTKEGIAIIPVMGKGNLAKWWRLFTAYAVPTYVIFDNDAKDDTEGTKRRDILTTLNIANGIHRQIMGEEEWLIEDLFSLFGKDFEETMRANFEEYVNHEEFAIRAFGDSKPILARYVASQLDPSTGDQGWERCRRLSEVIKNLEIPH